MRRATISLLAAVFLTGLIGLAIVLPDEAAAKPRRMGITLFGTPEVEMNEKPDVYEILVPLNRPEDRDNIQARIEPKLIVISGRYVMGSESGFTGTMSFHRTFHPRREILPETEKRTVKDGKLIITVDKKHPGPVDSNDPLPPDLEQELRKATPIFI